MWNNAYIEHSILRESLTTSALEASVMGEFLMKVFSMQDLAKLLASLQQATAKLSELDDILDVPNLRQLNNKAALYLLDCTTMMEEGGLRQGQALNNFVYLAQVFCAEVDGLA